MNKFIVVQTWNGEGYSYQNKIIATFNTETSAGPEIMKSLIKSILKAENVKKFEENDNEFYYHLDPFRIDSGSYQFFQITEEHVGILIHPEENEVILLTQFDLMEKLREAIIQSDIDDLELNLDSYNDIFINAYHEDKSYQFHLFQDLPAHTWKALVIDHNNLIYTKFFQMDYTTLKAHCISKLALKEGIEYTHEMLAEIATQIEREFITGNKN